MVKYMLFITLEQPFFLFLHQKSFFLAGVQKKEKKVSPGNRVAFSKGYCAMAERGGNQGGRALAALATFVCAVLVITLVVHDNEGREELMGSWMHDHSANPSKLPMNICKTKVPSSTVS
jgi:hypothetical protein